MTPIRFMRFCCCMGLALLGCNNPSSNQSLNLTTVGTEPVTSALPTGKWGGNDIELNVQNNGGGLLSFDCGTGATDLPIVPDETGHFDVQGGYAGFPDPNTGIAPAPNTVIYHGDVSGNTIGISVEFPNGDAPNGAPMDGFAVTHGADSQVMECQI